MIKYPEEIKQENIEQVLEAKKRREADRTKNNRRISTKDRRQKQRRHAGSG